MDVFISHSSANKGVAQRIERALETGGLDVWLDDSEIRVGVLLADELQQSIRNARVVLLLWSSHAAASRWVASEWLMAIHTGRSIVPFAIDPTPLPQCMEHSTHLRVKRVTESVLERVARAVREVPDGPMQLTPLMEGQGPDLYAAIGRIATGQQAINDMISERKLAEVRKRQTKLDGVVADALKRWPLDPQLVNLAAYQLKNAYMIEFWDAVQAGRGPRDPLLDQSERRFLETLSIDPTDPSALNGLGSILIFQRDLDAAEFFILAAIAEAKRRGWDYPDAEHDLALVHRYKRA